jgi:lysophospholipase
MLNKHFKNFEEYSNFYALNFAGVEHRYFEFKSNGFELAGQSFIPKDHKATLILIHGFMGHCGVYSKFFKFMLDSRFAIAAFDFPGHGLSTGEQTVIDDFAQYSRSIEDFLKIVKENLHGPYHIIGHSMGGAVVMDYLLFNNTQNANCHSERSPFGAESRNLFKKDFSTAPASQAPVEMTQNVSSQSSSSAKITVGKAVEMANDFDKVILAAPLVRCTMWNLSKIGYAIYRPFMKNIFRIFRNISSDKEYVRFMKYKDPLQSKIISMKWVASMFRWEKKVNEAAISEKPILVIQGTNEGTVDWKYNLPFIQKKFKRAEIEFIVGAQHEFFNEAKEYRDEVFELIRDYLK